jgi:hypothetical protein
MKLRSGKIKPSVPLCPCKKFWGTYDKKGKCTICFDNGVNYEESFKKRLKKYVEEKRLKDENLLSTIWFTSKMGGIGLLKRCLDQMTEKGKYLTADYAIVLLRKNGIDTNKRSHLICSKIIDWWNIKRSKGFNSSELCYFGNFGEGLDDHKFPPRLPNRSSYGY